MSYNNIIVMAVFHILCLSICTQLFLESWGHQNPAFEWASRLSSKCYQNTFTNILLYDTLCFLIHVLDFPGDSDGKESACNAEDPGSIPGSVRSPREGTGNPLQYSCLEKSVTGAWQASLWGCRESDTTEQNLCLLF